MAINGELLRKLRLVQVIDAELAAGDRVPPIKQRRRGISPGALPVSIAECQMIGGDCFDDMEKLRDDTAGALLRAVADVPSAPTARQLARKFRPAHIRAIERAAARCGNDLDRRLGRDPGEAATLDLDALESVVYGHQKCGTGRSRCGHLAYNSFIVTWSQRGRGLTSELKGGNQARITASSSLAMLIRAQRLLPKQHGQITVRGDIGFYSAELMMGCRERGMRFALSAPRTATMWRAVDDVRADAWQDAIDMRGAQVAELAFTPHGCKHEQLRLIIRRVQVTAAELAATSPKARRRTTIPREQLQMVLDGQLDSTYAYSFIVTDIPNSNTTAHNGPLVIWCGYRPVRVRACRAPLTDDRSPTCQTWTCLSERLAFSRRGKWWRISSTLSRSVLMCGSTSRRAHGFPVPSVSGLTARFMTPRR